MIQPEYVPDLVDRHDPDVVRRQGPPARIERGEGDDAREDVPLLVPGEVRLTGAIDVELHFPANPDFSLRRIGFHDEPDWDTRFRPALEGVADGVQKRRLKVRDSSSRDVHSNRPSGPVVPAVQRGILALGEHLTQVRISGTRPNAATALRARQLVEVARLVAA